MNGDYGTIFIILYDQARIIIKDEAIILSQTEGHARIGMSKTRKHREPHQPTVERQEPEEYEEERKMNQLL